MGQSKYVLHLWFQIHVCGRSFSRCLAPGSGVDLPGPTRALSVVDFICAGKPNWLANDILYLLQHQNLLPVFAILNYMDTYTPSVIKSAYHCYAPPQYPKLGQVGGFVRGSISSFVPSVGDSYHVFWYCVCNFCAYEHHCTKAPN